MNSSKDEYKEQKKVAFLIFVLGLIMSFLIPVWQSPDEYSHLRMIGNSVKIEDFADNVMESIGIENERIEFNYDEKVNIEEEKQALWKEPTYERIEMLPKGVTLSIIKHFPATLGMMLGIIIGFPTIWVMHLGELFSLLFYTVVCYYSLKIMPVKKSALAFVMTFPMALQQAGSINYDAVLIPLCFLFISYTFFLKYTAEIVRLKDMFFLMCVWGIIVYIKMPYAFLAFLILLIPLNKFNIAIKGLKVDEVFIKKTRIFFLIFFWVVLVSIVYLFRHNMWIQIIYGFVAEWKRGIYLFLETGKTWGEFLLVSTVGNFGWLDTPMNLMPVLLLYMLAAFFAFQRENEKKLRKWDYFILAITIFCLCVFTTIALTNHTIKVTLFGSEFADGTYSIRTALYQIPYIGGLQGRYYLPFVGLFFILLPQRIRLKENIVKIVFITSELILYIYVFVILLQRYWFA